MQKKLSKKINPAKQWTDLSDRKVTVNDETSCEKNMELIKQSTSQEILIGMGTNLYNSPAYQSSNAPITKYRVSAYLKFPVANTQLLSNICDYFNYDRVAEKNRNPEIGWLITDECNGYYLPEVFFYTATELVTFLREIQGYICFRDVLDGSSINNCNLESVVWESI